MSTTTKASAFLIGITGHMDIPEGDIPEIEERCRQLFRWIRSSSDNQGEAPITYPDWWPTIEAADDDSTEMRRTVPLPGLGLGAQRLVLLTSLAPGIDSIAARIALEVGIEVRSALPFPEGKYQQSTTFTGAKDPKRSVEEFTEILQADNQLVEHFPVLLASDIELSPEELEEVFEADLKDQGRRHLRYRASGEYVGTHSHLLFAFFQTDPDDEASSAGSQTIVQIARTGPTPGILPAANHFAWNDAVPVIHIPCRSLKRLPEGERDRGSALVDDAWMRQAATFLSPLWLEACHLDEQKKVGPECGRMGLETLRRTASLLVQYEAAAEEHVATGQGSANEAALLLFGKDKLADALSDQGKAFLEDLEPIAAEQNRSSELASDLDQKRKRMMRRMAIFTFLAAFFFHCFTHWYFKDKAAEENHGASSEHSSEQLNEPGPGDLEKTKSGEYAVIVTDNYKSLKKIESNFAIAWLVLAMLSIGGTAWAFYSYQGSKREWLRFDSRAFSEGLRVQFYWLASGNRASVAERYMHRQKGELDWIRNAISSMSFPYFKWRDSFQQLPLTDQKTLLRAIIDNWVVVQRDYFYDKGKQHAHRLHRHHLVGWGMTWAGVAQVPLFFVWKCLHPHDFTLFFGSIAVVLFLIYAGLAGSVILKEREKSTGGGHNPSDESHGDDLLDYLLKADFPGFALLVGSVLLTLVAVVPDLAEWTPKTKDLWVILTGSSLVIGAISIAWAEKLLLAEHSRQYSAMHDLFRNAATYLNEQMEIWNSDEPCPDELSMADPRSEIQETLVDIGKEALDENAEWLVLHRSRPFEPFLAG